MVRTVKMVLSPSELAVGDTISFACNGRGRGGHYGVSAVVTKVNRKTVAATEKDGSYHPGTKWTVEISEDCVAYKETLA